MEIMIQTLLFILCINCIVLLALSSTAKSEPIQCTLNRRTESCPKGQCCARDEFLPSYIICKDIGNITSSCSTVPDDSVCPCEEGLVCVPNINSKVFVSIHGTCQQDTTTTSMPIAPTTISTTRTTTPPPTTVKHNHPPLIRLQSGVTKVSKNSRVGKTITILSVVDNDQGKDGDIQCSVLQPPLFKIKKENDNSFKVVIATSLSRLTPQSVLTFIICEDNGTPKSNGIAELTIQIVKDDHHSASSPTIATTTPSSSTSSLLHSTNMAASSISTLGSTSPRQVSTSESISTLYSSTKRPLASVTLN